MAGDDVMRCAPHDQTLIGIVRHHVDDWRRDNGWSRETVVQQIVEAHERLGFDRLTGIRFEPPTTDAYGRMKINAERVYRWLDDTSKDKNLLPANMLWSILAAMPMDRRQALAWALLAPVDLGAVEIGMDEAAGDDHTVVVHLQALVATGADSQVAVSKMLDGIDPGESEAAQAKLGRALSAVRRALSWVTRRKPKGGKR
jgi:hypothetical protein